MGIGESVFGWSRRFQLLAFAELERCNQSMNANLLRQIIEPFAECLTQESTRKIVEIRDEKLQLRLAALANKATAGTLTESEKSEYDRYLAAFHFMTILQARARHFIKSWSVHGCCSPETGSESG